MNCRHCRTPLHHVFVDLGSAPPSNSYLDPRAPDSAEAWYPLKAFVCENCRLVQLDEFKPHDEIFSSEYAYFSSYSPTWLEHARRYSHEMIRRLDLGPSSFVCEIASNDGYLLRNFSEAGIPCLGIEPTTNTAEAARAIGIETWTEFFGKALAGRIAKEQGRADLVIGNNVLAHVPDIGDFVEGVGVLLKPEGVATFEFPHLLKLVAGNQFDTVYHEHFSYLSLSTAGRIFESRGLRVFDVDTLETHGGSLRLHVCHATAPHRGTSRLDAVRNLETDSGMDGLPFYLGFQEAAERAKDDLLVFLIESKRNGREVAAYGAAAKGNTLLNYAGVRPDLLPYVVDASPHKQGRLLPGSRIPIVEESRLRETKPNFVLILPWNLRTEIARQLSYIGEWGGQFVTAIPSLQVFPTENAS